MTDPSIQDVDAAVRSVLLDRTVAVNGGAKPQRRPADVFPGRLLSLRHVESLPRALRELRIAPGTVVTPLARDGLKRLGVELRVVSRTDIESTCDRGEWGFAIESETGLISALRRSLLEAARPWTELPGGPDSAPRWVTGSPGRGALLFSDEASVAVWGACRFPGVRAASAHDVDAVARAVRSLGVNLLVVEPAGKSIALLRQMGMAFQDPGAPRVPPGLAEEEAPCGSPR